MVILVALMTGCDDSVNPVLESDQDITLFGTLDMNADRQFLRVIPVRGTIDEEVDPSTVALRSIDLDNGTTVEWSDSLVTFDNGRRGLVFYADLRVQPGHSYRIEATQAKSDIVTSAVTNIPPVPTVTIMPETASRSLGPTGIQLHGTQTIVWHDLQRTPYEVSRWYRFLRNAASPFQDVQAPAVAAIFEGADMTFQTNLVGDRVAMADSVDIRRVALVGVGMSITILNVEFVPPGGVFDPEILVQPGTFSNVENGFGFIGAVGRFSAEWVLAEETLRVLEYVTVQDAFGKTADQLIEDRRRTAAVR